MRVGIVLTCLIIAAGSVLLLNGQAFSNSLVALAAVAIALGVSTASARGPKDRDADQRRWRIAAFLTGLLVVVLLAQLPAAYHRQRKFNEIRQKIRELNRGRRVVGVSHRPTPVS